MTQARLVRDWKDTQVVLTSLQERNPFCTSDVSLRSIYSVMHANKSINIDKALEVGSSIVAGMDSF